MGSQHWAEVSRGRALRGEGARGWAGHRMGRAQRTGHSGPGTADRAQRTGHSGPGTAGGAWGGVRGWA
ncbi:hypothetical protein Voc01_018190 [Virgisporangium ochraceum]|uniref:Uncharacterized protein n=1 Tax=Virgisporangium ochraceum TaxID=65505 RepID=A0A8J3ZMR0_9ACTN|nr:hypothetical protein Voc01_018190 [Virgisporangium ochraceum]